MWAKRQPLDNYDNNKCTFCRDPAFVLSFWHKNKIYKYVPHEIKNWKPLEFN